MKRKINTRFKEENNGKKNIKIEQGCGDWYKKNKKKLAGIWIVLVSD